MKELAPRELEVVRRICEGLTNDQIAIALGKKKETIKRQVSVAMDKTGTVNRVDLAMWAVRNLLFNPYTQPRPADQAKEVRPNR
jgi:DNA-binding NarL/FixJ family response regulator